VSDEGLHLSQSLQAAMQVPPHCSAETAYIVCVSFGVIEPPFRILINGFIQP
jgi:hypothetical protein